MTPGSARASFVGGGEYGRLSRVVIKPVADAWSAPGAIAAEWRDLNFSEEPDLSRAIAEYERFREMVASTGAEVLSLPPTTETGLDSIYTRDASILAPTGVILCRMGKAQRQPEPVAQRDAFRAWGIPVIGAIAAPGHLEGGDVVWLDERTVVVGEGYRTNAEGIRQLRAILGASIEELIVVPLPHWKGHGDVFHLMSIISPVDRDLAVVYSRLMSVPFRQALVSRGISLVEVPDDEFDSMGANVLAVAPRMCVMLSGNPVTARRLEKAGASVVAYDGREISWKGGGGPTCLTRPIDRVRQG
jgi:N-dimethylarginine dimethylaminohydrolase